jgi:hypothetical protein
MVGQPKIAMSWRSFTLFYAAIAMPALRKYLLRARRLRHTGLCSPRSRSHLRASTFGIDPSPG